ncbi:MAG: glycosyltransferase, partial [Vicinamibacterales bacterium]
RQLLQHWIPRTDDYAAEFRANHPDAPPDLALLFAGGHGGSLYTHWPFVRLVLQGARLSAVHSPGLARRLGAAHDVEVETLPMGVPDPLDPAPVDAAAVRARYGVPADAFLLGAVGGVTPEKRLPQVLTAMQALIALPIHLLVVGAPAAHYDLAADAAARGLADRVHVTGFVPDAELGAHLAALDACACLRWPSNGETSASWWRAMAAGRATIVTDLPHQTEIPVRDARTWQAISGAATPVAAAVRILDEHRGLVTALQILATDAAARHAMGAAARAYWAAHHTLESMADAYVPLLARAAARPAPAMPRPLHLDETGEERVRELLAPFDLPLPASVAGDRA